MKKLYRAINAIPFSVQKLINTRLNEFNSFKNRSEQDWFSELCFCLLTANSKAKTALSLQTDLGFKGFSTFSQASLTEEIKVHKHRFHNTKAARIIHARKHLNIKNIIQSLVSKNGERSAREWLVENVSGLGYKEASHFLRNTGHTNVAIIDRHIFSLMKEYHLIKQQPSVLSRKNYFVLEEKLDRLSQSLSTNHAKLDLMLWYLKTGEVLK